MVILVDMVSSLSWSKSQPGALGHWSCSNLEQLLWFDDMWGPLVGDICHQPNSRGLQEHYKDSLLEGGMTIPNIGSLGSPWHMGGERVMFETFDGSNPKIH